MSTADQGQSPRASRFEPSRRRPPCRRFERVKRVERRSSGVGRDRVYDPSTASLPTISSTLARSAWKTRSGSSMGSARRTTALSSVNAAIDSCRYRGVPAHDASLTITPRAATCPTACMAEAVSPAPETALRRPQESRHRVLRAAAQLHGLVEAAPVAFLSVSLRVQVDLRQERGRSRPVRDRARAPA